MCDIQKKWDIERQGKQTFRFCIQRSVQAFQQVVSLDFGQLGPATECQFGNLKLHRPTVDFFQEKFAKDGVKSLVVGTQMFSHGNQVVDEQVQVAVAIGKIQVRSRHQIQYSHQVL